MITVLKSFTLTKGREKSYKVRVTKVVTSKRKQIITPGMCHNGCNLLWSKELIGKSDKTRGS